MFVRCQSLIINSAKKNKNGPVCLGFTCIYGTIPLLSPYPANKTAKTVAVFRCLFDFKFQLTSLLSTEDSQRARKLHSCMTKQEYSSPNMEKSRKNSLSDPETAASQSQHGHISLASSPSRSDHSSGELKPHTLQERLEEDSAARSSISSDRSSLSHGSSPSPIAGEDRVSVLPLEDSPGKFPDKQPTPVTVVNRSVRNEPPALSKSKDPGSEGGRVEGGGGSGRRSRPSLSILRRTEREQMVKKAALGFRVFGFMFCLVSFSVMAADRNQGWALDSFNGYKEFRYCMSTNVIGSVYSGAQAFDLLHQLITGKSIAPFHLRYYFDFAIDQMVSYLLISASSSAATRIEDWKSNWGSDKFPDMASAAVSMSFLAFAALASSSLISGYALCTSKST